MPGPAGPAQVRVGVQGAEGKEGGRGGRDSANGKNRGTLRRGHTSKEGSTNKASLSVRGNPSAGKRDAARSVLSGSAVKSVYRIQLCKGS